MLNNGHSFRLDGRVALVTGSTRGLGKEIALELAQAGAQVAMNYANDHSTRRGGVRRAAADRRNESCLVHGDVTDPAAVERACAAKSPNRSARSTSWSSTPPASQPQMPIEEYDWAFFQPMLDFFVKSPVLLTQACLPHMKQQRWGRIIHITSEVFALAWRPSAPTSPPKAGRPASPGAWPASSPAPASRST